MIQAAAAIEYCGVNSLSWSCTPHTAPVMTATVNSGKPKMMQRRLSVSSVSSAGPRLKSAPARCALSARSSTR